MRSTRKLRRSLAQLAPGADHADIHVIGHGERPDRAPCAMALLVGIGDAQLAPVADGGAHLGHVDLGLDRVAARDIDRRVGDVAAQAFRQDDRHLVEHPRRGVLQFGVAHALHHARAHGDRLDLVDGEHQRRQVEALAQHVAQAGRALDRHAARLQGRHVAIDRAHRDLELLGKGRRRHRLLGGAEDLDDVEQAVGAAHAPDITLSGALR